MALSIGTTLSPIAAALLAAAAPSSLVFAQDGLTTLEEIVVTAQRQETLLQETPIAVTAFSAQKIQDLGIFDITDIGSLAPNTNIQKQPSSNSNTSIYIRGVGSGETALMVDPKVSFYIDGVYMSKTIGAVFDIVDMESVGRAAVTRIEVMGIALPPAPSTDQAMQWSPAGRVPPESPSF